ncbi:mgtC family protein [Mycobacterium xenopi 4042]|uniref:MgtC family protein n=1 Tax=Mycobacterium xenopi 4042 TaxID=1299334 RepID=X8BFI3_MYCXE|nr:mgtC family protein [Mycobacterium xenopi 4042]
MQTLSLADFALRLAVGLGCGALIGLERQWRARMAGLRTNALVATGRPCSCYTRWPPMTPARPGWRRMWCLGSGFSAGGDPA